MLTKSENSGEDHNIFSGCLRISGYNAMQLCVRQRLLSGILKLHCKVIIGRNPIEANANTVAIQLPGNPAAYIGKCFTPY